MIRYSIETKSISPPPLLLKQVGGLKIENLDTGQTTDYPPKAKNDKLNKQQQQKKLKLALAKILLRTFPNEIQKLYEEKKSKKVKLEDQTTNLLTYIQEKGKRNALILSMFLQMQFKPKISGKKTVKKQKGGDCTVDVYNNDQTKCGAGGTVPLETAYKIYGLDWKKIYNSDDYYTSRISEKTISTKPNKYGEYNWDNEVVYNDKEKEQFTSIISHYGCEKYIKSKIEKFCRDKQRLEKIRKRNQNEISNYEDSKTEDQKPLIWEEIRKKHQKDFQEDVKKYLKKKHSAYKTFVTNIQYSRRSRDEYNPNIEIQRKLHDKDALITKSKQKGLQKFVFTLAEGIVSYHSWEKPEEVPPEFVALLMGLVYFLTIHLSGWRNSFSLLSGFVGIIMILMMYNSATTVWNDLSGDKEILFDYIENLSNFYLKGGAQNQRGGLGGLWNPTTAITDFAENTKTYIVNTSAQIVQKNLNCVLIYDTLNKGYKTLQEINNWRDLRSQRDLDIQSEKNKIRIKKSEIDGLIENFTKGDRETEKESTERLLKEVKEEGESNVTVARDRWNIQNRQEQLEVSKKQVEINKQQLEQLTRVSVSVYTNGERPIDGGVPLKSKDLEEDLKEGLRCLKLLEILPIPPSLPKSPNSPAHRRAIAMQN